VFAVEPFNPSCPVTGVVSVALTEPVATPVMVSEPLVGVPSPLPHAESASVSKKRIIFFISYALKLINS
jgi:hypothetical protein